MSDFEHQFNKVGRLRQFRITNTKRGPGYWLFVVDSDGELPNLSWEWRGGSTWWIGDYNIDEDDLSSLGAVWVSEVDEETELFEPGPEDLDTTDYASSFVPFWAPDSIPALSNHWWVRYILRLRRRTIRARIADVFYGVATRLDYRREND